MTAPMIPYPALTYVTATHVMTKHGDVPDRNVRQFSAKDPVLFLVSMWARRGKVKRAPIRRA